MAREITPFNLDYANRLRLLHEAGRSVLSLSKEFGHQRFTIQRWIERAGGTVRNRSEAMFQRMATTSAEERQSLSRAAHDAVRGVKRSDEELRKRAIAKKQMIGHGEPELLEAILVNHLPAEGQRPCGKYNIDIAVGDCVAVELVTQGNLRITRLPQRSKYLRDHGFCVITVTFRFDRVDCLVGNLNDVVALVERAYRSPSMRRKNWMVWCRSERFARIRNDLGQLTAVEVPERFFNIVSEVDPN